MSRHSILARSLIAATLLTAACAAHAQAHGIIRFVGRIVEPPCSFDVDETRRHRPALLLNCPRPVAGNVSMIDGQGRQQLAAVRFDQHIGTISLSSRNQLMTGARMLSITYQ